MTVTHPLSGLLGLSDALIHLRLVCDVDPELSDEGDAEVSTGGHGGAVVRDHQADDRAGSAVALVFDRATEHERACGQVEDGDHPTVVTEAKYLPVGADGAACDTPVLAKPKLRDCGGGGVG